MRFFLAQRIMDGRNTHRCVCVRFIDITSQGCALPLSSVFGTLSNHKLTSH